MSAARESFLRERQVGIGGSDIAAILGFSKRRSPYEVWLSKTRPIDEREERADPNEWATWGRVMEPVIADEYSRRTGLQLARVPEQLHLPDLAIAVANPDRVVVGPGSKLSVSSGQLRGATGVVEIKTVDSHMAERDWGVEGEERIPLDYTAQAMWYMGIAALPFTHFAVLAGGNTLLVRYLEFDRQLFRQLVNHARAWWENYVVARVPPPPINERDVLLRWPRHTDKLSPIDNDGQALALLAELRAAREVMRESKERFERVREKAVIKLAGAEGWKLDDKPVVTYRAGSSSVETDWVEVAEELRKATKTDPATLQRIVQRVSAKKPGSRRFVVK